MLSTLVSFSHTPPTHTARTCSKINDSRKTTSFLTEFAGKCVHTEERGGFKIFRQVLVILSRVRVFGESTLAIFGALTAQHVGVK